MSERSDARLGLSEFLAELGAELSKARSQTEKNKLTYDFDEVTLELDIAYTLKQSPRTPTKVKPKFWVLGRGSRDAEDGLPSPQWNMQRLILRLTPRPENVHRGKSVNVESRLPPERRTGTK